jgi:hypothetical protein
MRIFQITGFDEWFEIRPSLHADGDHNGDGPRDRTEGR